MDHTVAATKVHTVLEQVLHRDLPEISGDTRLFEDLNLDSTSVIELLIAVEDETGMEVDVDALDPDVFLTVGSLTDFVATTAAAPVS